MDLRVTAVDLLAADLHKRIRGVGVGVVLVGIGVILGVLGQIMRCDALATSISTLEGRIGNSEIDTEKVLLRDERYDSLLKSQETALKNHATLIYQLQIHVRDHEQRLERSENRFKALKENPDFKALLEALEEAEREASQPALYDDWGPHHDFYEKP